MDTITTEMQIMTSGQFAELLRLSSPALPIGGFSYSQGLESAVELGIVTTEDTAGQWIEETLHTVMTQCDATLWALLFRAWREQDINAVGKWNQWYYATRETAEAREETTQMAISLMQLVQSLGWGSHTAQRLLNELDSPCFPAVHAYAVAARDLPQAPGLMAFLYAWVENQVTAAIKIIPLGQTAGQRLLSALIPQLDAAVDAAIQAADIESPRILTLAPQYAIVAARHESQFSRLFRS